MNALQPAAGVETYIVFHVKGVALAGHVHVFSPWQAHFGRLPGEARDHGAQAGRAGGLRFLSTKAAAHAAHVDHDVIHWNIEYECHQFLDFGGVVG